MKKPTLVIMAAGMGSRFGGLKQMTPVDEQGHFIMDYSIFDAIRAGFGKVICVIKPEMKDDFEEQIGVRIRPHVELVYAYQTLDQVPEDFSIPEEREKPWGTGHAVLCAAQYIDGPFVVINADDFYGQDAFRVIARFLTAEHAQNEYAMVGYPLRNTLTENGTVSRGVCTMDEASRLKEIVERTKILRQKDGTIAFTEDDETYTSLPEDTVVSMNFWGFQVSALEKMKALFRDFLMNTIPQNPMKAEFYLHMTPACMIEHDEGSVEVLRSDARWYGVTYQDDLPGVKAAIAAMKQAGDYPDYLWK